MTWPTCLSVVRPRCSPLSSPTCSPVIWSTCLLVNWPTCSAVPWPICLPVAQLKFSLVTGEHVSFVQRILLFIETCNFLILSFLFWKLLALWRLARKTIQRKNQFQGEQDQAVFVTTQQHEKVFTQVILVFWIFIICVFFL